MWPALIIGVGLLIVARWAGRTIPSGASSEDVIRATAVFGGPKLVSTARHLPGAWLTAIFGGVTLDLRGACPAPDGASVNATVAFGGIDILVPKGWRISVRSTPIFGGIEVFRTRDMASYLHEDMPPDVLEGMNLKQRVLENVPGGPVGRAIASRWLRDKSTREVAKLIRKHAPKDARKQWRKVDAADGLGFIAPVFWLHFPAILKGWFEHVFFYGAAVADPPRIQEYLDQARRLGRDFGATPRTPALADTSEGASDHAG